MVSAQLRSSAHNLKAYKEKQAYSRLVGQTILKKYRMLSKLNWLITRRMQRWRASPKASPLVFYKAKTAKAQQTQKFFQEFFNDDMNSFLSPGKKEFAGNKQKVRYMTDSLVGLCEKFSKCSPIEISFSQFCRLRPRHVKKPNVTGRDTCACSKCENSKLLVSAFHKADLVDEKNLRVLVQGRCCDNKTDECLTRCCEMCKSKIIHYNLFDPVSTISFQKWSRESVPSKSKKKTSQDKVCCYCKNNN